MIILLDRLFFSRNPVFW